MATNEKQRRVEQFQLYVYALNLLSSSITLAQDLISDGKVKSSQTLKEGLSSIVRFLSWCQEVASKYSTDIQNLALVYLQNLNLEFK